MNGVFYCRLHEHEHLMITQQAQDLNSERLGLGLSADANGCWLWTGPTNDGDYGLFVPEGANTAKWYAHRVAWGLLMNGHQPRLELDHRTCKRPNCVNPFHLEPVAKSVNQKRKRNGPEWGWTNPDVAGNSRVALFAQVYGLPVPPLPATTKNDNHTHPRTHKRRRPASLTLRNQRTTNASPNSRRNRTRQGV